MSVPSGTVITVPYPCDFHHHFRQGTAPSTLVPISSERFGTVLAMPNTKPPITTVGLCLEYNSELRAAADAAGASVDIVNVLYLTDNTSVETVDEMSKHPFIRGFKYYPAGATTNSDHGVTDITKCHAVIERMLHYGMILCIHSEVSRGGVDIFDREKVFIAEVMTPLIARFPTLKIVMEHISTSQGVDFVSSLPAGSPVVASITPHHLLYNRNALLVGGIKPHFYCLPILKRESHRLALLRAATSGSGRFILGTDSAPHTVSSKESCCGCAGVYNGNCAVELYVEAFESAGKLDSIGKFFQAGKDFYGVADGGRTMKLVKEEWKVDQTIDMGEEGKVKPIRYQETVKWKIVK